MVATDGHRLAQVEYKTSINAGNPGERDQDFDSLQGAGRAGFTPDVITRRADPVRKGQHHLILCRLEVALLTSRQLTGTFPNYEAVLPRDNANRVVLQREEFSLAIRRVAQFSDERSNAVRIRLGKDELKVSSSSVEIGESEDTVETAYSGDPTTHGIQLAIFAGFPEGRRVGQCAL